MMRFFFCRNGGEEERMGDNFEDKPRLGDQVANEDMRSIGSVGNGSGSGQHGSKSDRILQQT